MIKTLFRLSFLLLLGATVWLAWYVATPMRAAHYPVTFSVQAGSTLKAAARGMAQAGALRQPWAFVLLARFKGVDAEIKAGSYALNSATTPLELLRKITAGETLLGKLTVPEGWTFAAMRHALNAHSGLRHDSASMNDAQLMGAIGAKEVSAEGHFFPDTYFFDPGSSDLALYKRAYAAMRRQLDAAWATRAPGLPFTTPDQALTLASLVERETGAPEERPLIAAVFINRLRLGMRLQTDPSVIYGLGERYDGSLHKEDLLNDTAYNTYTRAGLPPTPIALPGVAALYAALNPDTSSALYFVAKGHGRHAFSSNLEDHNRAVNRYVRGR